MQFALEVALRIVETEKNPAAQFWYRKFPSSFHQLDIEKNY